MLLEIGMQRWRSERVVVCLCVCVSVCFEGGRG